MNTSIRKCTMLMLAYIAFSLLPTSTVKANINKKSDFGIWQGTMDGKPGEGGLFYRLEFKTNGTVDVLKQYGGNNIKENKRYLFKDNFIYISGNDGQKIDDFEKAQIKILDSKTMRYEKDGRGFYLNKWNFWATGVHWFLMLALLIALNEIFRRYKFPTIIVFFVLPIVLIPLWSSHGVSYWFKWVKLYSVVLAVVWFTLFRYTKLGNKNFAKFMAAAFLSINIGEAVFQDFSMGYWANILNAIGGILSIITLSGYKKIHADKSKEKDMVWPAMTVFWIVAYDIWNFVFVYLNFPGSAGNHLMVLLACTIPSLFIKKGTWLQARAFTLALWFMYYFTAPLIIESHLVLLPRNEMLMFGAGLLSFVANVAYGFVHFRKTLHNKKEPIMATA